jgi:hypothetical protein
MAPQQHSPPPRERIDPTGLRSALWLPIFDSLADPAVVARLAAEAEEAGWHGVFVWDQLRWRAPVRQVADPWITLAAVATATQRLRLGPMVTPLARRRPVKVARETATLDRLSDGRLTLGVGLGSDRFAGELSKTGEQLDDRLRAQMLDEALAILTAAWSGEPVHHRGEHYTVDGVQFCPDRCSGPGCRCGSQDSLATSSRCAEPSSTTGSSLPTSSTPISSPRSRPPSPSCARTPPRPSTSWSARQPAPTRRPGPGRAPPGGCRSSRPESRWTRCAACSETARGQPEHEQATPDGCPGKPVIGVLSPRTVAKAERSFNPKVGPLALLVPSFRWTRPLATGSRSHRRGTPDRGNKPGSGQSPCSGTRLLPPDNTSNVGDLGERP